MAVRQYLRTRALDPKRFGQEVSQEAPRLVLFFSLLNGCTYLSSIRNMSVYACPSFVSNHRLVILMG